MIHPSAEIHPSAVIADDVSIGPFTIVGEGVEIGAGTKIASHVVIKCDTRIGENNQFFQFSSIGEDPQDMSYQGEKTYLEIGDNNIFREFCTVNRGTSKDHKLTKIGSHNFIMSYVHIAHDCVIHDHVVMANMTTLAGHIEIEDYAMLGGGTLVHQFCHIGRHAFTAGGAGVAQDITPHTLVRGNPAAPRCLNLVGLRRRGFSPTTISNIKQAYRLLYRNGLKLAEARKEIEKLAQDEPELQCWVKSIDRSARGIARSSEDS